MSQPAVNNPGLVSLDINALTATILLAISEVLKTALSKDSLTEVMRQHPVEDGTLSEAQLAGQSQSDLSSTDSVTTAVNDHVSNLTGAGTRNDSLFGSRQCST